MGATARKKISTERLFYKIGEVSDVAGVEPHVLRYWESEFPFLKPRKNKTGQRIYTRKDLEMVLHIKTLLYKEKYTIAGVRKKFGEHSAKKSSVSIQTVHVIRKRLKEILNTLNKNNGGRRSRVTKIKKNENKPQLFP
jgi:DNA-binding transcriptional MerR regulator